MANESPSPIHNQFLATPEQLAPYEAAFAPFAEAAYRAAGQIDDFRSRAGLDPYGLGDVSYDTTFGEQRCLLKEGGSIWSDGSSRWVEGLSEIKGAGSDKWVTIIDGPDGQKYAVKGMRLDPTDSYASRKKLDGTEGEASPEERLRRKLLHSTAPLIAGESLEGLEQLVAVDLERNLMVTTTISPSQLVVDMSGREIAAQMRRRHVEQLARTRVGMRERGLHYHNAGGILFNRDAGFLFVDPTFEEAEKLDPIRGLMLASRNPADSTESLIQFIVEDHRKIEAMQHDRAMGSGTPYEFMRTTGLRAVWQGVLMRWAREIDARTQTGQ
ncbi:MAG TPA: hypothetical protein VL737_01565 [Candidatus Pristimantibacillus sp.]|nr:hypothetical protein [Candidatus Pristimantibacillus sp.]